MNNPLLEKMPDNFKDKFSYLIQLFIIKDFTWTPADWKREAMACSRLIKKYEDFDFFYFLPDLTDKFQSLCGLQTPYWKKELDRRYQEFLVDKKRNKDYHI